VPFDEDDDAEIPGVDIVELPGVDVTEQDLEDPAPQIVEIDDLDIPVPDPPPVEMETTIQDDLAAPVEPAPVAQPAEPHGTRRSARVKLNRLQILLCSYAAGERGIAQSRRTHVCTRRLLPSRT
jgi:hypothetical protein